MYEYSSASQEHVARTAGLLYLIYSEVGNPWKKLSLLQDMKVGRGQRVMCEINDHFKVTLEKNENYRGKRRIRNGKIQMIAGTKRLKKYIH